MRKYFELIIMLLMLFSCSTKREFNAIKDNNSILELEAFINEHPKSKFIHEAQKKMDSLVEDTDWAIAELRDTIPTYQKYLELHEKGLHAESAKSRMSELQEYYAFLKCNANPLISCYEQFLIDYPNSIAVEFAKKNIRYLTEDSLLKEARKNNTIEGYIALVDRFPDPLAFEKDSVISFVNKLQIAKNRYHEIVLKDDLGLYQEFVGVFWYSNYADSAQTILDRKEKEEWNNIRNSTNLNKLRSFIDKFPNGKFFSEINDRYVELKIKKIYEGRHLPIPEMISEERTSDLLSFPEISLLNLTDLRITVTYSGPTKVFIEIPPKKNKTLILAPGDYQVTAEADNVIPFYGSDTFQQGMNYSSEWYIETKRN